MTTVFTKRGVYLMEEQDALAFVLLTPNKEPEFVIGAKKTEEIEKALHKGFHAGLYMLQGQQAVKDGDLDEVSRCANEMMKRSDLTLSEVLQLFVKS